MKRTPKNYDGLSMPAKPIQDLLAEVLNQIQKKNVSPYEQIIQAWPSIIGPNLAKMTRAVSFVNGVLSVNVKSSTLYTVLCLHEKPRLLKKIQEQFPQASVCNILFCVGI
jgi:predicted nucleic acid-binding Zn ribbon protein